MSAGGQRDTDADWQRLGERDPYWAIVTQDQYRRDHFDAQARARFYESGRGDIDWIHGGLIEAFGAPTRFARALDFGCGAGRLMLAMGERCSHVAGVDVAQSMRDLCAAALVEHGLGEASVHASIEAAAQAHGPFDWINSYIVLQHIAPARGLDLIAALLASVAPSGYASLHVTAHRAPHLQPRAAGLLNALKHMLLANRPSQIGQISMFDYDMSAVLARFAAAGCARLSLIHTDHGGHHGYMILARKDRP